MGFDSVNQSQIWVNTSRSFNKIVALEASALSVTPKLMFLNLTVDVPCYQAFTNLTGDVNITLKATGPLNPVTVLNETANMLIKANDTCAPIHYQLVMKNSTGQLEKANPDIVRFGPLNDSKIYVNSSIPTSFSFGVLAFSRNGGDPAFTRVNVLVDYPCKMEFLPTSTGPVQLVLNMTDMASPVTLLMRTREMFIQSKEVCAPVNFELVRPNTTAGSTGFVQVDPAEAGFDPFNRSLIYVNTSTPTSLNFTMMVKSPAALLPGFVDFQIRVKGECKFMSKTTLTVYNIDQGLSNVTDTTVPFKAVELALGVRGFLPFIGDCGVVKYNLSSLDLQNPVASQPLNKSLGGFLSTNVSKIYVSSQTAAPIFFQLIGYQESGPSVGIALVQVNVISNDPNVCQILFKVPQIEHNITYPVVTGQTRNFLL